MKKFDFEVIYRSKISSARVGRIHTPHGIIDTPNFVAVGTNGTLKALDNTLVNSMGLQLMFCNTYHLLLQPGVAAVERAGGLHKFINRKGPIITDSGGFQVFSMAYGSVESELKSSGCKKGNSCVLKIEEEGITFRSYRDGSKVVLTPESSVEAQKGLGADIIIPLDELPPYHVSRESLIQSLERTHRWEKRSLEVHLKDRRDQAMYGVVHGGTDYELRKKSCQYLRTLPFDGYAIGGSFGKTKEEMLEFLKFLMPLMPFECPNHLLGIGDLESIEQIVPLGIDTFDSSYPTRAARHAMAFTKMGRVKLTSHRHKFCSDPIDPTCHCSTCQNYSLAYLHHLFKAQELVGLTLATIHNLHFMVNLMQDYRKRIVEGQL